MALVGQLALLPRASFAVGLEAATTVSPQFELGLRARGFPDVEWAAELGFDALFNLAPNLNFELGARAAMPVTRYRFTVEGAMSRCSFNP